MPRPCQQARTCFQLQDARKLDPLRRAPCRIGRLAVRLARSATDGGITFAFGVLREHGLVSQALHSTRWTPDVPEHRRGMGLGGNESYRESSNLWGIRGRAFPWKDSYGGSEIPGIGSKQKTNVSSMTGNVE